MSRFLCFSPPVLCRLHGRTAMLLLRPEVAGGPCSAITSRMPAVTGQFHRLARLGPPRIRSSGPVVRPLSAEPAYGRGTRTHIVCFHQQHVVAQLSKELLTRTFGDLLGHLSSFKLVATESTHRGPRWPLPPGRRHRAGGCCRERAGEGGAHAATHPPKACGRVRVNLWKAM